MFLIHHGASAQVPTGSIGWHELACPAWAPYAVIVGYATVAIAVVRLFLELVVEIVRLLRHA